MPESLSQKALSALRIGVAMAPWVISMYAFYWLDSSGTWTSETPHRGKLSVMILGSGMLLSFLAWSLLGKRSR